MKTVELIKDLTKKELDLFHRAMKHMVGDTTLGGKDAYFSVISISSSEETRNKTFALLDSMIEKKVVMEYSQGENSREYFVYFTHTEDMTTYSPEKPEIKSAINSKSEVTALCLTTPEEIEFYDELLANCVGGDSESNTFISRYSGITSFNKFRIGAYITILANKSFILSVDKKAKTVVVKMK